MPVVQPVLETVTNTYIYVMERWYVEQDSDPGSGVGQKWRPQQVYGSNQVLFAQPQTIFSTPQNPHVHA